MKLFLKRTLCGCEFGIYLDLDLDLFKEKRLRSFCLIDQDPLLVFTINVRSNVPQVAGILIIRLVYLTAISNSIAEWILIFSEKITKTLIKKTLIEVAVLLDGEIQKFATKCNKNKIIMMSSM